MTQSAPRYSPLARHATHGGDLLLIHGGCDCMPDEMFGLPNTSGYNMFTFR